MSFDHKPQNDSKRSSHSLIDVYLTIIKKAKRQEFVPLEASLILDA